MRVQQARDDLLKRLSQTKGRPVTSAEAMTLLGSMGRRVIAEAGRADAEAGRVTAEAGRIVAAQRKAAKKGAKKAAGESLRRSRIAAQITESLTAAQAPAAPVGAAPAPQAGSDPLLAMGANMRSPFWRSPDPTAETATAPEPSKPLHEMDAEEFRAHAAGTTVAYGRGAGHHSPIWR